MNLRNSKFFALFSKNTLNPKTPPYSINTLIDAANSKLFNSDSIKLNNGSCGIPTRGARTCKQVMAITSGFGNSKLFNLNSFQLNNGGCGIMAITSGCGPGNESSILSFRPSVIK